MNLRKLSENQTHNMAFEKKNNELRGVAFNRDAARQLFGFGFAGNARLNKAA